MPLDSVSQSNGRSCCRPHLRRLAASGKAKRRGWCIPCGHVEWDEQVKEDAIRETREENGLLVTLDEVLAVQSTNLRCADHRREW